MQTQPSLYIFFAIIFYTQTLKMFSKYTENNPLKNQHFFFKRYFFNLMHFYVFNFANTKRTKLEISEKNKILENRSHIVKS